MNNLSLAYTDQLLNNTSKYIEITVTELFFKNIDFI